MASFGKALEAPKNGQRIARQWLASQVDLLANDWVVPHDSDPTSL